MTNREALVGLIEYIRRDDYIEDAKLADWLELLLPSADAADEADTSDYVFKVNLRQRIEGYLREISVAQAAMDAYVEEVLE